MLSNVHLYYLIVLWQLKADATTASSDLGVCYKVQLKIYSCMVYSSQWRPGFLELEGEVPLWPLQEVPCPAQVSSSPACRSPAQAL